MKFKSVRFIFGITLTIYGTFQLLWGWYYAEMGKNEAATVGVIRQAYVGQRSSTYEYSFEVGGTTIYDSDGQCETALTKGACKVGTAVVVYYDRLNPSHNLLNEYGVESRGDLHEGEWMVPFGLVLLLWLYVQAGMYGGDQSQEEPEDDSPEVGPEILHVVPPNDV